MAEQIPPEIGETDVPTPGLCIPRPNTKEGDKWTHPVSKITYTLRNNRWTLPPGRKEPKWCAEL